MQHRTPTCDAAREEVGGNLRRPRRLLEDRPSVVGLRLGHSRPPRNVAARPTTIAAAASAVVRHSCGRCLIGACRVGRQAVDLRLVEQQEERAEAADTVVRVLAVEARPVPALLLERREAGLRALAQLVELAELDRVGGARLRTRGLVTALQAVVTERALPDAAVFLPAEHRQRERRVVGAARQVAPVDDAERARRHAVAAAVADVLLHDDRPELGAEERTGRARVEAARMRAVLADVRLHQPTQRLGTAVGMCDLAVELQRLGLLDEGDMTPRVRVELHGVVVARAGPLEPVLGQEVPFLARDLAGLAADADRRVGEEADSRLRVLAVGGLCGAHVPTVRSRRSATSCASLAPRGRRPGRMSHVNALTSWMCTFGSSAMCARSFAASPFVNPRWPQW